MENEFVNPRKNIDFSWAKSRGSSKMEEVLAQTCVELVTAVRVIELIDSVIVASPVDLVD